MQRYDKFEVSLEEYEKIKKIQIENGSNVQEHFIGTRKKLIVKSKMIATTSEVTSLPLGGLSKQQFNSFLGRFNKELYAQFKKHNELYDLQIKFDGFSREKNYDVWESLPQNSFFYNIDLSSAYWQIAFKLGYITKRMFETYIELDAYKEAKRYCISFLARSNKMTYTDERQISTVCCDTQIFKQIYANIRNELYVCIKDSIIGVPNWLEYNIDGVSVLSEDLSKIKNAFNEMGLIFKVCECQKISNTMYLYKGVERVFKRSNDLKNSI